ncbi:hypothetical protein BSF44_54840 [Pseudomonas sp. ACN8]|nr:hypothetical protein BSF44_54840 [Pseudomonas sp. ACN8]
MSVKVEYLSSQREALWSVCFGIRRVQFRHPIELMTSGKKAE